SRWGRRATTKPSVAPAQAAAEGPREGVAAHASASLLVCAYVRKAFRVLQALAGVTLEVRAGEILGLIGPNGSGKSTLINVVSGYYQSDGGRIALDGQDIARVRAHRIASLGLARTYPIPRSFPRLSVLANIALAAPFAPGPPPH